MSEPHQPYIFPVAGATVTATPHRQETHGGNDFEFSAAGPAHEEELDDEDQDQDVDPDFLDAPSSQPPAGQDKGKNVRSSDAFSREMTELVQRFEDKESEVIRLKEQIRLLIAKQQPISPSPINNDNVDARPRKGKASKAPLPVQTRPSTHTPKVSSSSHSKSRTSPKRFSLSPDKPRKTIERPDDNPDDPSFSPSDDDDGYRSDDGLDPQDVLEKQRARERTASTPGGSDKIQRMPEVKQKLDNGKKGVSVKLWMKMVKTKLRTCSHFFATSDDKRLWLLEQTLVDGKAHQYLTGRINKDNCPVASVLLKDLVQFMDDPNQVEKARQKYAALHMDNPAHKDKGFWNFFIEFQGLAAEAEIEESQLKSNLRDKILHSLRERVVSEYKSTRSLNAYAQAINDHDTDFWARRGLDPDNHAVKREKALQPAIATHAERRVINYQMSRGAPTTGLPNVNRTSSSPAPATRPASPGSNTKTFYPRPGTPGATRNAGLSVMEEAEDQDDFEDAVEAQEDGFPSRGNVPA